MAILLARGAKNIPAEVQRWQYFLLKQGISQVGSIDADFGLKTEQATKFFQVKVGITTTGKLDQKTHDEAVALGYRDLTPAYYNQFAGTNWPPKPAFPPPSNASRNAAFGAFNFLLLPASSRPDHESIVIKGAADGSSKDWVAANIIDIQIPQLAHVPGYAGRFRCHRLVAPKVKELFDAWEQEDLLHLLLGYAGAFVARYVRGTTLPAAGHGLQSSASVGSLSNHAFGSAFDINVAWNPRVTAPPPPDALSKGSVRLLVPAANRIGFGWGGHYAPPTKYDGMHFEFADFSKL
ncbi:MAG: hypothetical protein RLZZ444_3997 [Pseudomonadota bacterium]